MKIFRRTTGVVIALLLVWLLIGGSAPAAQAQQSCANVKSKEECRKLKNELKQVEKQIDKQETKLNKKRKERRSLERDVEILEGEIRKAQLEIQRKDIQINNLSSSIAQKKKRVSELANELERKKKSLAELIRRRAELDDVSLVEVALSNESLSEFFQDIDSVQSINDSLQTKFAEIRKNRKELNRQRAALAQQRNQVTSARQTVAARKKQIQKKESKKAELAAVARSEERSYENTLEKKKARARQIRNKLFSLRDVNAIPFGRALQYAREVSKVTGVRPAFLLAILKQESNLGRNVGTCNRPQDPPSKKWDQIMKPSRDIPPYKRITSQLGINPGTMPLSCPYGNGWGGAMGPAQFIPSTWEKYQSRIASALGVSVPNPWEPRHAFMASGIYLSDLGAGAGTPAAERRAALKYYAGSNWQSPRVAFYGDQVLQKARSIQNNMIDPIEEVE